MSYFLARHLSLALLTALSLTAAASAQDAAIGKHNRWVTAASFTGGGKQLVTVGGESLQYRPGDVKIWDATSGALVASCEGHPTNVWAVCASADGKLLITTGYDGK